MKKICGVYKITNTITGDFYIGSSKNVNQRLAAHKCPSTWKKCPDNPMYHDMRKYGKDKFEFQILAEVEIDSLKESEQKFIEILKPTYNNRNAKGLDIENRKEYHKEYRQSDKCKSYQKQYHKEYNKSDKFKEYHKEYDNQLCRYNGKKMKLHALYERFRKAGIEHPTLEAKKYIIKN